MPKNRTSKKQSTRKEIAFNLKSFVLISENFEFVFEIVDVRLRADAILHPVQHRVGRRLAQDVRRRQRRR